MTRGERNVAIAWLLALSALLANAQEPGAVAPVGLASLDALIETQYAWKPVSVSPDLADQLLLIDDVFVTTQNKVEVTLRNAGDKTITAWTLDLVAGSDSGTAGVSSFTVDRYTGLLAQNAPPEYAPLRPNETRLVKHELPFMSDDRLTVGSRRGYSVVGVDVRAIVLDDGTVAGPDVRSVLGLVLERFARAAALSRWLGRVESAVRYGRPGQLLDHAMESREREQRAVVAALTEGPGPVTLLDSQRRQDAVLLQEWLQTVLGAVLRRSSPSELEAIGLGGNGEGVPEIGELLSEISSAVNPETLALAIDDARSIHESELVVLKANLPAWLRSDIDAMPLRRVEE